jgi:hypothetical protein
LRKKMEKWHLGNGRKLNNCFNFLYLFLLYFWEKKTLMSSLFLFLSTPKNIKFYSKILPRWKVVGLVLVVIPGFPFAL